MGLIGMRFHPRTHSTRRGRSILAVLDRALAGHRKRRRPGCRGIVLGTQSQCNQRKRIDFAAALQLLLALKAFEGVAAILIPDRKSTRLNSSHLGISYAVFCLKKK